MKKLFFLSALLCASLMSFAVDQDTWIGTTDATYAEQFKWYEIDGATAPSGVVEIQKPGFATEIGIYITFADAGFNAIYFDGVLATDGTEYSQQGAGIIFHVSAFTKMNTTVILKNDATTRFGFRIYNKKGSSSGKADPMLVVNPKDTTIDASKSETFEISASKATGAGAITYTSDNSNIASVDENGVVTAVGRGTAKITVSVAENETHEAASKKVTVNVTGPINWNGINWLSGSNDQYKLVVTPDFGDTYGGKHVENNSLWIGFPSAAFGAMSIEPNAGDGAWRTFALSNFPNRENQFTVVCDGNTYTFDVYNNSPATAIDNTNADAKAVKVIENGQLIIIKNGIRYNALGAQMK